jgi:hypothetical protein
MAEPKQQYITFTPMNAGKRIRKLVNGMLWCSACQDWHPKDDFPVDLRATHCRRTTCKKAANRMIRKRRRIIRRKRAISPLDCCRGK